MTPQEKDLIQAVFDRLAANRGAKDAEAEAFIRQHVQAQPDAAYGLVQAVVMLEAGLNQAQARIAELQKSQGQGQPSGSFLGGAGPWGGGSVPRSGAQMPYGAAPQASYPVQPAPAAGPWAQPTGGNSFLRNAATMAAGVAGGTLIAEGLTSLLGGHRYGGFGGGFGGGYGAPGEVVENVTVNNYYDNQSSPQQAVDDRASYQDASYDSGDYDDGGFDGGADV